MKSNNAMLNSELLKPTAIGGNNFDSTINYNYQSSYAAQNMQIPPSKNAMKNHSAFASISGQTDFDNVLRGN